MKELYVKHVQSDRQEDIYEWEAIYDECFWTMFFNLNIYILTSKHSAKAVCYEFNKKYFWTKYTLSSLLIYTHTSNALWDFILNLIILNVVEIKVFKN